MRKMGGKPMGKIDSEEGRDAKARSLVKRDSDIHWEMYRLLVSCQEYFYNARSLLTNMNERLRHCDVGDTYVQSTFLSFLRSRVLFNFFEL